MSKVKGYMSLVKGHMSHIKGHMLLVYTQTCYTKNNEPAAISQKKIK